MLSVQNTLEKTEIFKYFSSFTQCEYLCEYSKIHRISNNSIKYVNKYIFVYLSLISTIYTKFQEG